MRQLHIPRLTVKRTVCIWTVALLLQLYLAFYVSTQKNAKQIFPAKRPAFDESTVCLTHSCRTTAQHILNSLDVNVDPCENFYDFACGQFMRNSSIPRYKEYVNTFDNIEDRIKRQVLALISLQPKNSESRSVSMVKTMFNTCINVKQIDGRGSAPLMAILLRLGGWPVLTGNDWVDSNWTLTTYAKKIRGEGFDMDYLFTMGVDRDPKNITKSVFGIASPSFAINVNNLAQGMTDDLVKKYARYMENVATKLGAIGKVTTKDLSEILEFEISLAKIYNAKFNFEDVESSYNPMALNVFQNKYNYFEWKAYLSAALPSGTTIKPNETVVVLTPDYLSALGALLGKSKRRTVVNYLLWRVVHESIPYLSNINQLKDKHQSRLNAHTKPPTWKDCVEMARINFPVAVGAMYTRRYSSIINSYKLLKMVQQIIENYKESVSQFNWMDSSTKNKAIQKLRSLNFVFGQPLELLNSTLVEEYYATLDINPNHFLESMLQVNRFNQRMQFRYLRQSARASAWLDFADTAISNAFYSANRNTVFIPAGALQHEMFSDDRLDSLKFGAIGTIIGHEIWHALDILGGQFDGRGNMYNWWSDKTKSKYQKQTECFIDHYVDYASTKAENSLKGKTYLLENVADFMGTSVLHKSYEAWSKNRTDLQLPNIEYTPRKLFWIAMAQNWCQVSNKKFSTKSIDVHAPDRLRVLGMTRHIPQFSADFGCRLNTNMNPILKCKI